MLTAVNTSFANNLASNDGGGVFCSGSSLNLAGAFTAPVLTPPCGFRNNTAGSTGGALAMLAGNGSVADCLIVSNHARYTGGIALAGATFNLLNTVVVQNDGSSAGGCSVLWSTLFARHCTIANNVSNGVDTGSGMFIGAAYLTNCIVWGNVGAQLSGTGTKGVYYSDVQGGSAGAGNLDANPLFAGPAVFNYQLTAPSPCINTGIFINVTNDCIGMPRPVGAGVDLGAYEFVPEPAAGSLLIFIIYKLQITISRRRRL
ncbi:MAG: hypothetical protein NTV22_08290 [bacterium]|nr:hypothetical protein [bacterium]